MKKLLTILLSCLLLVTGAVGLTACGGEKNITVVARHQGSGTREAFDTVVTDGNGNFLEMKVDGKKVYKTTSNADIQKETGNVMSKVASDKNAIGYISLGSVNNTIKVVNVNGSTSMEKFTLLVTIFIICYISYTCKMITSFETSYELLEKSSYKSKTALCKCFHERKKRL